MDTPYEPDPKNRLAVRNRYGDVVYVANSEECAEFILRACNAHDKLREVLAAAEKEIVDLVNGERATRCYPDPASDVDTVIAIREVLAATAK